MFDADTSHLFERGGDNTRIIAAADTFFEDGIPELRVYLDISGIG